MDSEGIKKKVSESAPLLERLDDCMYRVGRMCSELRPPKMTIPVNWNDDDLFITTTILEAIDVIKSQTETRI